MSALAPRRYTYEEYLAQEELSEIKHEFCDGAILAMAGGTPEHSLVKFNLGVAVANALRGRPCRAFDCDLRVLAGEADFATYPDLSVVCGQFVRAGRDKNALTNPTALFEVLSHGTAAYDLGEKFDQYCRLPTLREYVVVESERIGARTFRLEGGIWALRRFGVGEMVALPSIGISVGMADIYDGWEELRATARE